MTYAIKSDPITGLCAAIILAGFLIGLAALGPPYNYVRFMVGLRDAAIILAVGWAE